MVGEGEGGGGREGIMVGEGRRWKGGNNGG